MSEYKFVGPYEQTYLFPGQTVVAKPGDIIKLNLVPPVDGRWEPVPDSTPVTETKDKK